VVVDFWAPWCGPCRIVSPQVELLASEHPELRVAKLDVDKAPEIAARYEVYSIPTIVRFERGEVGARVVGALPYPRLAEALGIERAPALSQRT
jgi:thioredoxin